MVLLGIMASLFVAIQDPIIQKFAVRFAGGYLSEKTGADIKVGRLVVTPSLRIYIDQVSVKDLKKNDLAVIGSLKTRIHIGNLLEGKIHVKNVELRDTEANLITYEGENRMNFAFFIDAFASDKPKEKKESKPMEIIVDKIVLKNLDFMLWNQNKANPLKTEKHLMDYSHLDLDDINLEARDFYLYGDSIHANIVSLSATELSGLDLKHLATNAVISSKGIFLDNLQMETNNSLFDLDLHMLCNGFGGFKYFVDSVVFDATIRPSDIMLSDIGVFTEVMYKMPDRVNFEGRFTGPIKDFRVDDINAKLGKSTSFTGSISMHPLDFMDGMHTLNIKRMDFTYDDLVNFYIPSPTKTIPLPESLRPLGKGRISLNFKGSYNDFVSDVSLKSGFGDIIASVNRSKNAKETNLFSGHLDAKRVKVGTIVKASKYVGDLDLNANFMASFPKTGRPEFVVDGRAVDVELIGNHVDEIKLDGSFKGDWFDGKIQVDDDDLFLDFTGLIDFRDRKSPKSDFEAVIRDANLHTFHLFKEEDISQLSTKIKVKLDGFDLDNVEGYVLLDSTFYVDSRGGYFMEDLRASIVNDNLLERRININCDFLDFEMGGQINFASLMMTLNDYMDSYVHFPIWQSKRDEFQKYKLDHNVDQDFFINLNLKDTRTISRLLMPSVSIAKNTSLKCTYTSWQKILNLTLRSSNVQVGKIAFNNLELKNRNRRNEDVLELKLDEIKFSNITATDTLELGLENFDITTRLTNDTIFADIKWDDYTEDDYNKALINTYFHPHEQGGIFSVKQAEITINDSTWRIHPDNFVDISDGRVNISNLVFSHHRQLISADGYAPLNEGDSIAIQLQSFDISNFDFFFENIGFNLDGFISGDAMLSSLRTSPIILADLDIKKVGMNGETIGDAVIGSVWDNEEKAVKADAKINTGDRQMLNAYGAYYAAKEDDNLDFTIDMDSLRLVVASPFVVGIVSRMQGYGSGSINVTGSLKAPNINGSLAVVDGGCKIGYLNTFYTFSPTVKIDNKSISFENLVLTDTLGNTARVEGQINHDRFKDMNLDLKMYPRSFLAMATTRDDNDSFYGTAIASGVVTVKGPFKDIYLGIKAGTRNGTDVTIPLNKTSTVKENDFIIFVNPAEEEEEEEEVIMPEVKKKSNFTLDLEVNATKEAIMKIILPADLGIIEASGNGNVKLGMATKEAMKMFGTYTIETGRFNLNFKNLVSKMFTLEKGGTISWTGSPTDGRINATGVYSVKGSLADLGVQVDSTSSSAGTVNVECLIHLKDALLNPTMSFGMRLPNASDDINQTVYSLIDTTNQAAMTTQVLSLLVLGKFAYAGNSASATQNLDLGGLLSTRLQFDITKNLNLGFSYHYGNIDSFDEYQVALRTQLFEDRLIIETNVGLMSSNNASNASNIIGEFDLYYKLTKDGRLQGHFYNHSNYNTNFNSFAIDRRSPYTQGLGLSYNKSFRKFRDLFRKSRVPNTGQPLIAPKKQNDN